MTDLTDLVSPELKGVTVDPQVAANQIGNLLHIIAGTGQASDLQSMTTPTITQPTAATSTTPTQSEASSDSFVDPSQGAPVNSPFGQRSGGFHPGIDLGLPDHSTVLAAMQGTVIEAVNSDDPAAYNVVKIQHANGLVTEYGHLSGVNVKVGDQVTAGQVIGASGGAPGERGTYNSSGPHLHFQVDLNGQPVDPAPYLAGAHPIVGDKAGAPLAPTQIQVLKPEDIIAAQVGNTLDVLSGKEPSNQTGQQAQTAEAASGSAATSGQAGDFFGQVLAGIGAPDTAENRRALQAWAQAEGMGAENNNPFATTQNAPGATSINSVGVRHYPDAATGVAATVQTLLNGNYANIIAALRSGTNALAVADAIAASPWGTGGLVRKVLGG